MFVELTGYYDEKRICVNLDRVEYIENGANNRTMIFFNEGHFISVKETQGEIMSAVDRMVKVCYIDR